MPRTGVEPDRHTRIDPDLATKVRGVHGFHAYCDCGWKGDLQERWGEAAFDAKVHRGWHKMKERGL